jgi:GH15 family glucan-1,4-alpha-glucosidase
VRDDTGVRGSSGVWGSSPRRHFPAIVLALVMIVLVSGGGWNAWRNPQPELVSEGLPVDRAPLEAWVRTGRVPTTHPDMVRRALMDLKGLMLPNGAALAGWDGPWRFVWPRDASFVAAAYCATEFFADAEGVFGFLAKVRSARALGGDTSAAGVTAGAGGSGRWAARYLPDGSAPVRDGRDDQLDGSGWVLWSAWFCAESMPDRDRADRFLRSLWPVLRQSADQIVTESGDGGLPPPSPDYWERDESELTLGTVAPLLAGLRSAVRIGHRLGDEVGRWRDAEARLAAAVGEVFGSRGFPRTRSGGADAIVAVLGPPFAPERADVTTAIERARRVLTVPSGGVTPGEDWRADGVAWTPQTALFALSAAARGDRAEAESILGWLAAHRTRLGSLPEKVSRDGRLAGAAPLGWTCALVVLTAAALDGTLPSPS